MLKPTSTQSEAVHGLRGSASRDADSQLAIAATFTAEPLEEVLQFWFTQLELDLTIAFADYNQIFQQLLNPVSLLAKNQTGINLLLLRIEDWVRFQTGDSQPDTVNNLRHSLERNSQEFIQAIIDATQRSSTAHMVVFCPCQPGLSLEKKELYQTLERTITDALTPINSVYLIRSEEIFIQYPVTDFYDESRDRIGHIPFTPEAFAAIGTAIARRVYALNRPPYKVIALDCDRTLWQGICGEDGPLGISVDAPFQALQAFMVRCSEAGFLLCLCSKNIEDDVWQVFDQRTDMPLRRDHLVSWRINWQAKSDNLRSLATELNVGLDSFIFIDDNPVECSEVEACCPEVLTLQIPEDTDQISTFLNHIWPLDSLNVTDTDRTRTQLYKENTARQQFKQETSDFNTFINGLQLNVHIEPPTLDQITRVSQLTQRTNQFNATTRRRGEPEIQALCKSKSGYGCRAVSVKDRFGDYGLVGVIIFKIDTDTLDIDTFLLSCRVLGRGVEHRMVVHLGELAAQYQLSTVTFNYRPTPKNLPVAEFLKNIGHPYQKHILEGYQYILPTNISQQLIFTPTTPTKTTEAIPSSTQNNQPILSNQNKSGRWHRIIHELWQPTQVIEQLTTTIQRERGKSVDWIAPRTPTEKVLSDIWKRVLRLDRIGLHDNIFDLGNTSLLAVNAFTAIEKTLGKQLPITVLLHAPTIETLAKLIDQDQTDVWNPLVTGRAIGTKQPLYIVHGGYGDVLSTAQIIDCLDNDQPVYILRGIGLDGQQAPLSSIEAMASAYIEAITEKQPSGPYQLAGQCSGGIIAFEMAQQLTDRGDAVTFLGLLDTPYPQLENHFINRLRYYYHLPTYRHHHWDLSYYLFTAIYYLRRLTGSFNHHRNELRKRTLGKQLQYIGEKIGQKNANLTPHDVAIENSRTEQPNNNHTKLTTIQSIQETDTRQSESNSFSSEQRFIKDRFVEVFLRAQKDYRPATYPGKIDFFLATQQSFVPKHHPYSLAALQTNSGPIEDINKLLFGWDTLVTKKNFHIHCVNCPHPSMLDHPYVQQLGQAIQIALDTANTSKTIKS